MHAPAFQTSRLGNRKINQDRCLALEDEDAILLAVADGMGGHARGELAAQAFVDSLRRRFETRDPLQEGPAFLHQAIRAAHQAILEIGRHQTPPVQPLTTCVAALIQGGRVHWAHVGDSRLYLFRHGRVFFQTRDHTPVAEMVAAGLITERQARIHPKRNQVSRCLGGPGAPPEITVGPEVFLEPGDLLLLCSDGLWSAVSERRLLELAGAEDLGGTLDDLAMLAEQQSYPQSDNITAVALRWEGTQQARRAETAGGDDRAQEASLDPLERAIAEIHQALEEYGDEMAPPGRKRDHAD